MLSRLRSLSRGAEPATAADSGAEVLAWLRAHAIPAAPAYYGLAYAALTDRTSIAAHAINEATERDGSFGQAAADVILAAMNGPAPDSDAVAAGEEKLRHQTLHLADLAAETAAATNQFGRDLSAGLDDLEKGALTVTTVISDMVERTRRSEQQLAAAVEQIDRLQEEVAEARNDAMRDSLTGLLNRRGIIDHVATLGDRPRTIALCDIDAFKGINDSHGHEVGDRVLKVVAAALEAGCAPHLVGRWGGEEFIVVLDEGDPGEAARIVDNVRTELAARRLRARETGAPLGTVTFSAGVTAMVEPLELALRVADTLLYRAKMEGRNRVVSNVVAQAA